MLCSSATCLTSKLDTEAGSEVSTGVLQGHVAAGATLSLSRPTWRQNRPIGAGSVYKGGGGAIYKVFISIIEWEELTRAGWRHEVVSLSPEQACESSSVEDGDEAIWPCIYIPRVSHLTEVIDRLTESFCQTEFSTAASPVASSSNKTEKKRKSPWQQKGDSWIFMS